MVQGTVNTLPWKGIIANAALYFVDRHVYEGRGDKAAFREYPNGRALSYGMLAVTSNKISGAFGQAGIAREERVEMLVLECIEFPQIFWGAIKVGVVPVHFGRIIRDCEALLGRQPLLAPVNDCILLPPK
jgi:acyl-coenzyme A synthetase/AMP-(fatty) acid ligase